MDPGAGSRQVLVPANTGDVLARRETLLALLVRTTPPRLLLAAAARCQSCLARPVPHQLVGPSTWFSSPLVLTEICNEWKQFIS